MMTDWEWARFQTPPHVRRARAFHRFRVLLRRMQGKICPICGATLEGASVTTLDHVIPKSRGGPDRLGNLFAAHYPCNQEKGNRMPTGCELIWLLAVNSRLGVEPQRW